MDHDQIRVTGYRIERKRQTINQLNLINQLLFNLTIQISPSKKIESDFLGKTEQS
jgi:hypothetical protein